MLLRSEALLVLLHFINKRDISGLDIPVQKSQAISSQSQAKQNDYYIKNNPCRKPISDICSIECHAQSRSSSEIG